ncbi:uncharacterized protein LOC18448986 [Amborella trichopoda]|uniref:uncharacterized protein LOC18448986 n=1 Tax=Amborella trichopoda TaxID=13333 RepID=UPI0005D32147|nr:uncharacterized protein LOC18448986 [Amborella trichopoda]|eukprot:XP_011628854.1 uncharacterized protein LOC18448986 [Amborella trichopoda]
MSAVVCRKRSFFEELHSPSPSLSLKRLRCSGGSTSLILLSVPSPPSPPPPPPFPLSHLMELFPSMDEQLLEKALLESGHDLDSAIRSLNNLCLGSCEGQLVPTATEPDVSTAANTKLSSEGLVNGDNAPSTNEDTPSVIPKDGAAWVELFVREMMNASNVDDARARASMLLKALEKSIGSHADAVAADNIHKENLFLKEHVEVLLQENNILKRAVTIQHERIKEYDERCREMEHLKQILSQYHEQVRNLEMNNYTLKIYLRQAQQNSSIPGRFHPDVF